MANEGSPILNHMRDLERNIPTLKTVNDVKELITFEQQIIDKDTTWRSCCLTVDKRALAFFSSLVISLIILLFCIYQLVNKTECEDIQIYISLITMIIGVYLPSPHSITENNRKD